MSSEIGASGPSGSSETVQGTPKWRPLSPRQRRVLGVLVEKAKTTPDAYPMSVNAIVTGCNQKNNRAPITNFSPEDVEEALEELRQLGAVAEVQQGGRVPRYRHYMHEWLGADKFEVAVVAELLLRGAQTVGELRGRASRMAPIADLQALRPILESLEKKNLLVSLSAEGRGQVVTHGLYKDRELAEVRQRHVGASPDREPAGGSSDDAGDDWSPSPAAPPVPRGGVTADMHAELQLEVAELRAEVARLVQRVAALEESREQVT